MNSQRKGPTLERIVGVHGHADHFLGEGKTVCRELSVAEQTYYRSRDQYAGMKAHDVKRLKGLAKGNGRPRNQDTVADPDQALSAWLRHDAEDRPR